MGGIFTSIGGIARDRIAAFDENGAVTDWNPGADNIIRSIYIDDGTVYVGGEFTMIGGQPRSRLASFDASGNLTDWDPSPSGAVWDLDMEGSTLYAGGSFLRMGSEFRHRLASFNSDGTLTTWNPAANDVVKSISIDGSLVYACGDFTSMGGANRNGLAAVSITGTGSVSGWDPSAATGSEFNTLGISKGIVYAGGDFSMVGTAAVTNLVAIDATTGNTTSWAPEIDGIVNALVIDGESIYVCGDFSTVDKEARNGIAAIDASGSIINWDAQIVGNGSPILIRTLTTDRQSIFIGGFFTEIGGNITTNLGAMFLFDETDPVFTSTTEIDVAENSSGTVYTAETDEIVTFSLGSANDESLFTLSSGAISFSSAPDFENPSDGDTDNQYVLDITATDAAGNATTQQVTITVTDADEVAPVITLLGANPQEIELGNAYTELGASATDDTDGDISGSIVIDVSDLDITMLGRYVVNYNIADASGNDAVEVTRSVNVVDTTDPSFTSATDVTADENISTSDVFYTATATDAGTITYSLGGTDSKSFTLGSSSGEITFNDSPDFETQDSYSVTITATDDSGNAADLALTITINDLDEEAPVFTSADAVDVDENIGTSDIFYTATATDAGTITYSLGGTDASSFSIGASSGEITFNDSPDFEMQDS